VGGDLTGAGNRVRTRDPLITNQVLYQLSYTGTGSEIAPDWGGGNRVDALSTDKLGRTIFLHIALAAHGFKSNKSLD
jgi:hypothetical protein